MYKAFPECRTCERCIDKKIRLYFIVFCEEWDVLFVNDAITCIKLEKTGLTSHSKKYTML